MTKSISLQKDCLSQSQTTALKGVLAICVLLSHIVSASKVFFGSILSPLVGSLGYLAVSVFFFLSGYGIMAQYDKKRETYLRCFLRNRVLSIYLLTVFLVLLYWGFHLIIGHNDSLYLIISSLLIGNSVVSNGWYLQVIVLFYLIWYLCFQMIRIPQARSAVMGALIAIYVVAAVVFFSDSTWYECSGSFLLGIAVQVNREKIEQLLFKSRRRHFMTLFLSFSLFAICYVSAYLNWARNDAVNNFARILFKCMSSPVFCIFVVSVMPILNLKRSKVLAFLGSISLEIYVLQGILIHLFGPTCLSIANGWLYIFCTAIGTILLAIVMRPLIRWVTRLPKVRLNET